ncbi:Uncharacterised protein [Escherichia coli]|nr:Uncharacterised protein [Escherichia coli]
MQGISLRNEEKELQTGRSVLPVGNGQPCGLFPAVPGLQVIGEGALFVLADPPFISCQRRYDTIRVFEAHSAAMALISNRQASIRIRVMAGSAVAARAMPHSRSTGIIISQNPVRQNILRRRRRRSSSLTVRPLALTASSQVIQTGLSGCRSGMRRFRRVLCWPSIWRQLRSIHRVSASGANRFIPMSPMRRRRGPVFFCRCCCRLSSYAPLAHGL